MSSVTNASRPEMTIVIAAITTITLTLTSGIENPSQKTGYSRATRNTPATTIVELCSSDDTGVGPAIASGSQVCSGNWPLLPMQAMNRATEAHSNTDWVPSPDSAQPEIAWMLKPLESRLSLAHWLAPKNSTAVPTS